MTEDARNIKLVVVGDGAVGTVKKKKEEEKKTTVEQQRRRSPHALRFSVVSTVVLPLCFLRICDCFRFFFRVLFVFVVFALRFAGGSPLEPVVGGLCVSGLVLPCYYCSALKMANPMENSDLYFFGGS